MSEWITPVFDRTAQDTSSARLNQENADGNKGALNYQDLNRIEGNFEYILESLKRDSIFIPRIFRNYEETTISADGAETKITYTDWQENNLPWLSEINRIRANYNALVRLFLVGLGLPVLVESNYLDYTEVNDWERIAQLGKTMFENMEKEYRYCGMEESGGDRLL